MSGLLSVSSLSVTIGGLDILKDIDIEARPGEILGIIGPNGRARPRC